ncbi:hypothetical protein Droror1_Dr00026920 [Drosera rotundifolia]
MAAPPLMTSTLLLLLLLISSPIALSLPSDAETVPSITLANPDDTLPVEENTKVPAVSEADPVVFSGAEFEDNKEFENAVSGKVLVDEIEREKDDDQILTPKEQLTIVTLRPIRRFRFVNRRFGGGRRGFRFPVRYGSLHRQRGDNIRARFDEERISGDEFDQRVEFRPRMMRMPLIKYRPTVMFPRHRSEDREGMVLGESKEPRVFFHSHHDHEHEYDRHDHDHEHEFGHLDLDRGYHHDHHHGEDREEMVLGGFRDPRVFFPPHHHDEDHYHEHRDHDHDEDHDHEHRDHDHEDEYGHRRRHHHHHHHNGEGRDRFDQDEGMPRMERDHHLEQDDGFFSKIRKFLSPF